jgi:hypothetical protein
LQQQVYETNQRAIAELNSREKIEEELAAVRREASILADPGSFKIALATSQPDLAPMQANWSPQLGIVLSGRKIQPPAGDRVLQLWLIPQGPRQQAHPIANWFAPTPTAISCSWFPARRNSWLKLKRWLLPKSPPAAAPSPRPPQSG